MEPTAIEIRVQEAGELRAAWLDGFDAQGGGGAWSGGLFVPGTFSIAAGSPVRVRIDIERAATTTILDGVVIWRRLPPREQAVGVSSITLRPGLGIAFSPAMRTRVLYLERLGRGSAHEARTAARYPTELRGELVVRSGERPLRARVVDVAVRGAKIVLGEQSFVAAGSTVELRVAMPKSTEIVRAPLVGRVAWIDGAPQNEGVGGSLGVRLDLATTDERLHWAKIVTRAREAFEEHPIKVGRLVG